MDLTSGFTEEKSKNDWRVAQHTFKEKLIFLHNTGMYSDVTFIVQEVENQSTEMFHGHSWILKMLSPVFEVMLSGYFKEKKEIVINDVHIDTFSLFFEYMYNEDMTIDSTLDAWDLYSQADKYLIIPLKKKCLAYIKENMSIYTACHNYNYADVYGLDTIKKTSYDTILKNLSEICKGPYYDFLELSEKAVFSLLDESFSIPSQCEIFNSLESWVDAHVDLIERTEDEKELVRRNLIEILIPKIRFMEMSATEFARVAEKSSLLTCEQKLAVFLAITLKDQSKLPAGFHRFETECSRKINCGQLDEWCDTSCTNFNDVSAVKFTCESFLIMNIAHNYACEDKNVTLNFQINKPGEWTIAWFLCGFDLNSQVLSIFVRRCGDLQMYIFNKNGNKKVLSISKKVQVGVPYKLSIRSHASDDWIRITFDSVERYNILLPTFKFLYMIGFGTQYEPPSSVHDGSWSLGSLLINDRPISFQERHVHAKGLLPCENF